MALTRKSSNEVFSTKLLHFVTKLSLLEYKHSKIYKPAFSSLFASA